MKQHLFLICAVLMTATIFVSAQTTLDLSLGNQAITAAGTYNVIQSGGGVTTNTLTINSTAAGTVQVTITGLNVNHTTSSPIMINSNNTTPVVITVNGENTLETSATDGHASINNASQANLTINGTGTVRSTILNSLLIRKYNMTTATSLYLTGSVKLISAGRVVSDSYSDAASGGTIEIDSAILENSGTYSIEMMKAANFVMKNGSIKNTGTSASSNAIQVQGTTGISISGGTITSEKHVVYIAAGAVVSITGGILTSNGMNCSAVYHNGTGMLTISNGTFKATATGAPTIRKQSTGGITINGGSFEAAVSNVIMGIGSGTGITINGGDFKATGLSAAVALTGTGYNLTMTGGTVRHTNEAGSAQAVRLTSTDCNFVMTGGTLSIPQSSAATVIRVDKKARATINNYFIERVDNDLKMYGIDGDSTGTVKQISGTNKSTINYVKGLENNIHCTFIGTPNKITAGTPTYWFKPEDTSNYTGLQLRTSNRYNITYGNLEGSTANNPTEYYEGAGIASFNNPTSQPTCKTFVGWFTASTGGTQVTSIPVTATGDYNLYAQWNNKPPFNAGEINTNGETVCYGAVPNTTITEKTPVSGGGGTITYQWQKSTDNSTWSTMTEINSPTYKPIDAVTQDTWFRRQAHSECEGGVFSTSVGTWKITVIPTAEGGTVSSAQTICYNTQPSALTLSGHVGTVVQWEWSPNGTDNWNAIANTTTTLTGAVMGNLTADCWYRAKVESSNNCSEDYSNAVKITVLAQANAGTISSAQTICYNTQPNNLTVSGHTGTVVRWEWSPNGTDNWTNIANTTTTLTSAEMGNLTADRWYRVVVKNGATCSEVSSNAVKITVLAEANAGTISSAQTICYNTQPNNLTLNGHVGTVVRWEWSANGIDNWNAIANTTTTLTSAEMGNLTADRWYRVVVKNGASCSEVTSGAVKITVWAQANAGTISSAQTICYNTQPNNLTLNGHVGTVVRWEWSANGIDNWTNIANTTTTLTSADMGNLTADRWYRVVVKNGASCSEVTSGAVKITVWAQANAGTISSAQTICHNTQPNNLTLNGHVGTVVRWEWSPNGTDNWTNIANTTTTLTSAEMGNLTADRWYRVVVKNGASCSEVTGGAVKIDIIDLNTITLTSAVGTDNQAVCKGDDITTITYATTGATGATITNLPNGVTGVWNANVITIQGTPTVTDTYTITLTGGCGNITAIGKITVNDLPAEPTATTTIVTNCTGTPNGTLTVTSPLGAGYTYSVDGGAFQSEVLFTDLASGNHTLTVKNVSSCTKSTTINIGATPDIPTINITGETTVCKGFTTALTASGAATYNWYKGNTASGEIVCSTAEFTTPPLDVNTTYTVKGTGGNGCTSTQSVTVTVNDKPTISAITQPDNLCAGDALTLTTPTVTNNGSNITSQGWFLNGVAFTSGTVVSYADNGKTLVYKATNNCGETTSNEVTITVNDKPTISAITQPDNLCAGDALTLTTPTVTNNGSNITSQGWFLNGVAFTSGTVVSYADNGKTLVYKATNNCGETTSNEVTITVNDKPTISAITQPDNLCAGDALTLTTPTVTNNGSNITSQGWFLNGVAFTSGTVVSYADNGKTLVYKATNNCGETTSNEVTITVNDKPTISAITQPDNLCAGDALTLTTPTVTNNGSNITSQGWFLNGVAFTSGTVVSYADNGKTLVYKATNNCGETTSNEVTITVNDKPTISAITQPDNLCAGDALTLTTPTVTNNGSNITSQGWFLNGVAFTSGTVVSYADNGKTLVYKATNNCGETTSNEVTITVNDKPTISAITQPDNLCAGDALTLTTPTVTNNGSNITSQGWFLNGVAFTSGTVVSYADNGKTLVYKATNNCGETTSNEVTITVNDKPTISAITQPDNLCAGDALTLTTPTVTNNGSNITSQGWFLNGVAFTSGTVVSYADNGKTLVYKATNNCGETTSNEVTITVNDKPTISAITQPDNLCAGDALTLTTPTVTNNGSNITSQGWFLNGVAFTSGTVVSYADNGKTLVYKATNNCGETTSNEVTITVNDKPTISAIAQPDNLCAGDALTLTTPTVTNNGSNITSQGWFLNGVAFTSGTVVSYADNGKTLVYKATNNCGETTSNEVTITVNDKPTISAITQPDNLCAGDALTLTTPTVTNNGSNITSQGWFLNGVAFTSGTVVSYADNGKTLVYKATNNCGETTSNEVTITVNDKPTISAIAQPDNLCAGDALTLTTPTVTNNGSNITSQGWFLNGVAFTSGTVVSYADNGKTLVYKATNNCGETTSNEVTITVNDKPTISAITQPDNLCAGDALTLTTPTVTNNGSNITSQGWFLNGVAFTSGTVVSYADNGKTLVYKATNNCGETTSNEVTINVSTPPTKPESITGNADVCLGETTTLTATGGGEGSSCSYQWGTGDVGTNIIEGATSESYTTLPLTQNTTYWVRRVGTSACNDITEAATINVTLTKYTITATSGENGTITPSGVTEYDCNATSTYTITPNEGYEITDVLVDGISVGAVDSYTFSSLNSNHTISVTFNLQKLRVITVAQPAVGGSTTGDGLYDYNTLVTVTATPNDGYEFVNWTGDITSTEASFSFNIKQDVILTANFKLIEYNITYETGVTTISNQNDLPTTYTVESHLNIPDAIAVRDFYTFNGWHLDAPDGQVVNNTDDLGSGDHTLYANLTRAIPGTEIVISLGRLLAVRNANDYAILRTALYTWSRGNTTLPSKRHYVEVGEPIPGGDYKVIITIDEEMPIVLERSFAQQAGAYPNPVAQYDVINIISENDAMDKCELTDTSGRVVKTRAVRTATGYQVEIPVGAGFYTLKLMDVQGNVSIHKIIVK